MLLSAPVSPTVRPGVYPLMDAVRALAALSIFAYHAAGEIGVSGSSKEIVDTLTVGVPVFFVVSGFLLYRPFALAHLEGRGHASHGGFIWRRIVRLVPAFWVALTIVLVFGNSGTEWGDVPALYGFAQVYDPDRVSLGIAQAWSLNCEVVYYALIPLVAVAVRAIEAPTVRSRLRVEVAGLMVLLAIAAIYKVWALSWGVQTSEAGRAFLFHPGWSLDTFVAGMGLALWSAHRQVTGVSGTGRVARAATRGGGAAWLLALGVFAVVAAGRDLFDEDLGVVGVHLGEAIFGVLFVLPAISGPVRAGVLRRHVLGNRALLRIGFVSYAFYLWHLVVVTAVFDAGAPFDALPGAADDVVRVVVALVGSLILAGLSWVLVERPALRYKGRPPWGDGRRALADPPVAAEARS